MQLLVVVDRRDRARRPPAADVQAAPRRRKPCRYPWPSRPPAPTEPHSLDDPQSRRPVRSLRDRSPSPRNGEIAQKVDRGRGGRSAAWAARPYDDARRAAAAPSRDLLEAEAEECAQLTTSEIGKPIRQSRNEVRAVLERIDWNIAHVGEVIAPRDASPSDGDVEERITYEPVGVVAHVERVELSVLRRAQLDRAGAARRQRRAATSRRSTRRSPASGSSISCTARAYRSTSCTRSSAAGGTGAALVDADIDMVCFTGSYATGRGSRAAAADRLVRVQLELGGKDAAYVCDDVDVESAALAVAEGAFYNGGQSCSAIERVYVHEAICDRVRRRARRSRGGVPRRRSRRRRDRHRPARARRAARRARGAGRRRDRPRARGVLCGGDRIDATGQLVRSRPCSSTSTTA